MNPRHPRQNLTHATHKPTPLTQFSRLHQERGVWGEARNTKSSLRYLDNEENFLDEVKSIFHNYLDVIIRWIKEKWRTQVLSCLRILLNTIAIKSRSRTPTNISDGTPCDNTLIYGLEPYKLLLQIVPFSLLAGGPGSASTKVQFFKHLKFLLQPNQKLRFGKYHCRIWLRNTANTRNRSSFTILHPWKPLNSV